MPEPAITDREAVVRDLDDRVVGGAASTAEELELGCYCIEPLHDEERAIACFERVLLRDPNCSLARIWLAYCYLHYSMDDESMRAGRALLETITEGDPEHRGAALLLSAELGDFSGQIAKEEVIDLLQRSVAAAPNWVNNRRSLATRYAALGHHPAADVQLSTAIQHIAVEDPQWHASRRLFEILITGRTAFQVAERMQELLRRLHSQSVST